MIQRKVSDVKTVGGAANPDSLKIVMGEHSETAGDESDAKKK